MRRRILAALLAVAAMNGAVVHQAGAQEKNANLREALQAAPEELLGQKSPDLVNFVDLDALRQISGGQLDRPTLGQRGFIANNIRPYAALGAAGADAWSKNAGVDLAKVQYFAGYMQPPNNVSVWGLASEADAAGALEGFGKQGATPAEGIDGGLANGAPLAVDLIKRDPQNPWHGPMGQTSVVAQRGKTLLQAAGPDVIRTTLSSKRSLLDNPAVETAVAGVEAASAGGVVAQATLYSPLLGLSALNPAAVLLGANGDANAVKAELEKAAKDAGEGVPPYFAAIMADVQGADGPALAISLAYPDCPTAEAAGVQVVERLGKAELSALGGEAKASSAPGKDGMCAATVVIKAKGAADSKLAAAAFGGVMRRDFNVLQIGAPPAK